MARDFAGYELALRYEAIIDRKKRFLVAGQQYAMPRQIKKLIYYDRKRFLYRSWVFRVLQKLPRIKEGLRLKSGSTCTERVSPLYRAALAFERERNNIDFMRKLRKDSKMDIFEDNYKHFRSVCFSEERDRKARDEAAKNLYINQLKMQKYG